MLKLTMKYITLLGLFFALAIFGLGCRKDVLEIRPYPVTLTELSLFLKQVPDPFSTTTFEFNGLNEDEVLVTPNGVRVFLTDVDNLFYNVTSPASIVACSSCSELKFVVTTAMTKGDILARELPTSTTDDMLLESGGMVQLKVYCGTTELQILPGRHIKIQLPAINAQENMFIHSVITDDHGFRGWKNTGQEVFKADWNAQGSGTQVFGYELIISQLGWSNCAKPLTQTNVTPFCINLESTYTGLNTLAYLVFDNQMVVAPLKFDDITHSFCFPNVPAGYPVRVVSVAKLESAYWLGNTSTETGTNSSLPLQPQEQAAIDLLDFLRGL